MTHHYVLTDGWTLSAVSPDPADHPADPAEVDAAYAVPPLPAEIAATVPGTVHTDLLTAGLIDDPYIDLNERKDEWIGHTAWVYRTSVERAAIARASAAADGAEHTELVFDGLDTVATVTFNGTVLGQTFNQHRTYHFDVTELLVDGANALEVRFDSAWAYAQRIQAELGDLPNAYPTPFNFIRKMAANFGWDWGPQLVTAGIWKEARLETWSTSRLAEVRPTITVDGANGLVRVDALLPASAAFGPGAPDSASSGKHVAASHPAQLALEVAIDGQATRVLVPAKIAAEGGLVSATLAVPDVNLWWPIGMGEQPLYQLEVRLLAAAAVAAAGESVGGGAAAGSPEGVGVGVGGAPSIQLDQWSKRVGFRTVELDTSEDEAGARFAVVVNHVPVFVRGANWIPDDCFPSRSTAERYRGRIEQAVDANLNLLRVWGGGIYERDEFYEACDELGIMVWQDFLFACAAYPEEQPIRSEVEAEAHDNVLRLSSHASLVLLNGCNENIWGWFDWGWQEPIGDRTWGLGYYETILPAIVNELAPTVPYWPGSPYSGSMSVHANDPTRGNVHIWDVWNKVDYTTYASYEPRFVSEFGFQGPPTWSTLTQSIHDEPLTETSPGMLLHQKADDGNGKLERGMAPHLPEPVTFDDWHYLTQLNQSRAIVFGIERYRSERPHCMGAIVWQLNDCWPVTSWAAIDGYGRKKPLWHGLKRANAERLLTVQPGIDGLTLVAVNDSILDWSVEVTVTRRTFDGDVLAREAVLVLVPALSAQTLALGQAVSTPTEAEAEVLVVEAPDARLVTHYFAEDKALRLDPPQLSVEVGGWAEGRQSIRLTAPSLVRGVIVFADRLNDEAWVDDADVDVVPGFAVKLTVFSPVALDAAALAEAPVLRSVNEVLVCDSSSAELIRGR
ncbi:glycoside hydrolase family 2 protein [Subtercola lobariae]|uniref:beta-mannosidase n=1 Tax=Subtercola lobariae TaxID=1588641 RepID=A0A917B3B8_9MICO|nr:glycoside hydrolase family 2 protein [Subtercola lobariae]GGF20788.1 beta-mannosidase [Subtercola lobariae]